jgi:glycosyltransferase involved in cell wall biosynthesis
MGKVSIVIPCYNYEQYLEECLLSCFNQTVKPYEIIIVDDKSQKSLDIWFYKFVAHHQDNGGVQEMRLIIHDENKGLSAARNTGIENAKGDYILCLDADDTLEPDFIELTVDQDDIVATYQNEFGARNEKLRWLEHPVLSDFMEYNQIPAGCLFKKELWEKVGGYDEAMREGYEDWDFWVRILKETDATITTMPFYLFNYRIHSDSMINETRKKHDRLKEYIMNKLKSTI